MAGFLDVLLRGLTLVAVSVAVGGVAWTRLVLRAEFHAKPEPSVGLALRVTAIAAGVAAATQAAVLGIGLGALASERGVWPVADYFATTFARGASARIAIAVVLAGLAWRVASRPAGPGAWAALATCALALVGSSAILSHAIARVGDRALLIMLDGAHQLGAAVWVGGLAHLTAHAMRERRVANGEPTVDHTALLRRFSTLALTSVGVVVGAGALLAFAYVGDPAAVVGTAYGVMILSKISLFAVALGLAYANRQFVRRAAALVSPRRLTRFVEVELGLGVTVLFAAASLTSLPPAVDVREDRATVAEVARRFTPTTPRLSSPPIADLLRVADPLMAPTGDRKPVEREWSEYNHHWAGLFVLAMGLLAALERFGVRAARHWPLLFLGLAGFLFFRNDPRAWPLGPAGFWESLMLPDVLQHRAFVLLIVAFAVFEWMVRTGRLPTRPWAYVFPLLCAVGGGLLLTHSHAMFNLKEEFLTEVTHAPLGILGAFAGWARWLELRLPESGRGPGWLWTGCLTAVGVLLLIYREG